MTSKRQDADRQFARLTRDEKDERTSSISRSITEAAKAEQDLKTAKLRRQREARDDAEAEVKK
jgi:hypothetical protein